MQPVEVTNIVALSSVVAAMVAAALKFAGDRYSTDKKAVTDARAQDIASATAVSTVAATVETAAFTALQTANTQYAAELTRQDGKIAGLQTLVDEERTKRRTLEDSIHSLQDEMRTKRAAWQEEVGSQHDQIVALRNEVAALRDELGIHRQECQDEVKRLTEENIRLQVLAAGETAKCVILEKQLHADGAEPGVIVQVGEPPSEVTS